MISTKIKNRLSRYKSTRIFYYSILDCLTYSKFKFTKLFKKNLHDSLTLKEKFDHLIKVLPSHQRKEEFCNFIEFLTKYKPKVIVEIGTADLGTHLLFSECLSWQKTMIAMDLEIRNRKTISLFNSNQDKRFAISGSSQNENSIKKLSNILGGNKVDLLFIDGDHTYEGVKKDFDNYKSFLSQTSLVAFHDIVPDCYSKTGFKTNTDVGDVPIFWSEIKNEFKSFEFTESPNQDGCGIGLICFEKA
jgi:cephalosporin hydroxylase